MLEVWACEHCAQCRVCTPPVTVTPPCLATRQLFHHFTPALHGAAPRPPHTAARRGSAGQCTELQCRAVHRAAVHHLTCPRCDLGSLHRLTDITPIYRIAPATALQGTVEAESDQAYHAKTKAGNGSVPDRNGDFSQHTGTSEKKCKKR